MTESELKHIFSNNLRDLCNTYKDSGGNYGMTQQELADKLNKTFGLKIKRNTISYWVNGTQMPRPIVIQQIAELFGKDAAYMLTDNQKRTHSNEQVQ